MEIPKPVIYHPLPLHPASSPLPPPSPFPSLNLGILPLCHIYAVHKIAVLPTSLESWTQLNSMLSFTWTSSMKVIRGVCNKKNHSYLSHSEPPKWKKSYPNPITLIHVDKISNKFALLYSFFSQWEINKPSNQFGVASFTGHNMQRCSIHQKLCSKFLRQKACIVLFKDLTGSERETTGRSQTE